MFLCVYDTDKKGRENDSMAVTLLFHSVLLFVNVWNMSTFWYTQAKAKHF